MAAQKKYPHLRGHLDPTQQIRNSLPRQQRLLSPSRIPLRKSKRRIKRRAHHPSTHCTHQHARAIKRSRHNRHSFTGQTQHIFLRHPQICVFDMRA